MNHNNIIDEPQNIFPTLRSVSKCNTCVCVLAYARRLLPKEEAFTSESRGVYFQRKRHLLLKVEAFTSQDRGDYFLSI